MRRICITSVLICFFVVTGHAQSVFNVSDLRCAFKVKPLGISEKHPALSWTTQTGALRGKKQSAYQIQVAKTLQSLVAGNADAWESGKVMSAQATDIAYAGVALQPDHYYFWRVRVWDESGKASPWSKATHWHTGLLDATDWKAQWIGDEKPTGTYDSVVDQPAPLFRKEFSITKKIWRATLYVTAPGYFEASINGVKVGDHRLDPGWTDYSRRIHYLTFDVTAMLAAGRNCAGITLGNGWYNPLAMKMWGRLNLREHLTIGKPCFIFQLHLIYTDGTKEEIHSDNEWKVTDGPPLQNNIYLGEKYDARKIISGWNKPGHADRMWRKGVQVDGPTGALESLPQPPVRVIETLKPSRIWFKGDTALVDFGVNLSGTIRLTAKGSAGQSVRMRYGELLYADSTLNVMTSVAGQMKTKNSFPGAPPIAWQGDELILSGKGEDVFQSKFSFHGFRYVEITGYTGKVTSAAIVAQRLSADVERVGNFSCSNPLFNRIQTMAENTFLSNLFSVQSDCPHRERFGYGGDILATCEALMYNFNMASFYAKTVRDYADAVRPNNGFTETAPFVGIDDSGMGDRSGPVAWGTMHPALVQHLQTFYGDRALLEEQYEADKRWMKTLEANADHYILSNCLGDHETIDPKSIPLTTTAFFYYNATLLRDMARTLERQADAAQYDTLAARIRDAFVKKFMVPGTGKFDIHTQADQAFALYFGLAPKESESLALQVLLQEITRHQGHVSTGMFGTPYMLDVLSRYDEGAAAHDLIAQGGFPGWAHMIEHGATTLWEHWEYSDNTYSHNHPMFGSVSAWFYRHALGIQPQNKTVGFREVVIAPDFNCGLSWAKGSYRSASGTIAVDWKKTGDQYQLELIIPFNMSAHVYLPASMYSMREGGQYVLGNTSLDFSTRTNDMEFRLGSGVYRFQWEKEAQK